MDKYRPNIAAFDLLIEAVESLKLEAGCAQQGIEFKKIPIEPNCSVHITRLDDCLRVHHDGPKGDGEQKRPQRFAPNAFEAKRNRR